MNEKTVQLKHDFEKSGYSREEEYFYRLNKELIEKRRKKLDQERTKQHAKEQTHRHWMKCPKCGSQLKEANLLGIYVDQCESCYGVYFDEGELQTLLDAKESGTFLKRLKKLFEPNEDIPQLF